MDGPWFYGEAGQALGPVSLEELLGRLFAMPNPHGVLVWREGQGDWREAGSVPEIGSRLPPPIPGAAPARPRLSPAAMAARLKPAEDAEVIAKLYRRLVLLVGTEILLFVVFSSMTRDGSQAQSEILAGVIAVALLSLVGFLAVTTYRLSARLDAGPPLLWTIGMFFPCLSLFVLLALSLVSQAWCKRHGIKVGFLGPTRESIEDLRRSLSTSAFD